MIEWAWDNQAEFFLLLLAQYIVIFEFQNWFRDHKLTKPVYLVFAVQDWLMNIVMSVWFLDLPDQWNELVTGRMKRYKEGGGYSKRGLRIEFIEEFRYRFALALCKILNIWDKGHC